MTDRRWQKIKECYAAASQLEGAERQEFLKATCLDDTELYLEVESLLESAEESDGLFERDPIGEVADFVVESDKRKRISDGQQIGRFEIVSQIGRGGMGDVFLARDAELSRNVAIKILKDEFSLDREKLNRFLLELRSVSALNHPNILTVYESGYLDGTPYIVTELVEGLTLRELLSEKDTVPVAESLDIAVQIAAALSAAHQAGVIHRDIKPENIMIREDGYVKVLDFGLAKLTGSIDSDLISENEKSVPNVVTESGMILGTVAYMSPEQASGKDTDERTDVWALGAVLYEMLSGRVPFEGKTSAHRLTAIIDKQPDPLSDIPDGLWSFIRKSLSKNVDSRYLSAADFLTDLRSFSRGLAPRPEFWRATVAGNKGEVDTGDISDTKNSVPERLRVTDEDPEPARATQVSNRRRPPIFAQVRTRYLLPGLLILLPLIAVVGFYLYSAINDPAPVTDQDEILLTEFENTTGEEIFDGTLKQGLTIALNQSPYLRLFPDAEIVKTLKLMRRKPDERVTRRIAAEICQRRNLKAYITGSVSKLGGVYVIGLGAVNGETGEVFAGSQKRTSTDDPDEILEALSLAAIELRSALGESLTTIKRTGRPLAEVTTSSLEALRAYSQGLDAGHNYVSLLEHAKRAVEIDPEFAMAWRLLSFAYLHLGKGELSREAEAKAFKLRERVPQKERFAITALHYQHSGEIRKEISTLHEWRNKFPLDVKAFQRLLLIHDRITGDFEKMVATGEDAVRLEPRRGEFHIRLIDAYIFMDRYKDAKRALDFAAESGHDPDYWVFQRQRFDIAFILNDEVELERQWKRFQEKGPNHPTSHPGFLESPFYVGKFKQAKRMYENYLAQRIPGMVRTRNVPVDIYSLHSSVIGKCDEAMKLAGHPLESYRGVSALANAARVSALCGKGNRARSIINYIKENNPDSPVRSIWVNFIEAVLALEESRPKEALEYIAELKGFERGFRFWTPTIKGRAYLALGEYEPARREFQLILDHPGWWIPHPLHALAQLGKARATKSKPEYEKFFEIWKDADKDLPALIAAKKEYAQLD